MGDLYVLGRFALASIPFCIIGLIGNSVVILIEQTREIDTTTNYLLANLAVSDAIAIFVIPMFFASLDCLSPAVENVSKFSCKFGVVGDIYRDRFISLNPNSCRCRICA